MVQCIHVYRGVTNYMSYIYQILLNFFLWRSNLSENCADPDEMSHYAAFHLDHRFLLNIRLGAKG